MEEGLGKEMYQNLFKNPCAGTLQDFSKYITQELSSGHVTQLSCCFKNVTEAVDDIKEEENTLDQILESLVHHDVVCTPDAVESLLSLFVLLSALCEKSLIGKTKLSLLVPVLVRDVIVNEERGIPLRIEAVKLANVIFGDVVNDVNSLAFQDLQENIEHLLVSAGDFELQAGIVELFFRVVPLDEREATSFSNNAISQAFVNITSPEFEAGCRDFLNTLNGCQQENRSVFSFPCFSASFGRAEVHQPQDDKIKDFWVDLNVGCKSISLFVEEEGKDGSQEGASSWETVLIKADDVTDYRLKETGTGEVALLLKLNHPASDLVTFLSHNDNQYIKFTFDGKHTSCLTSVSMEIFGSPKVRNGASGCESDVSSTPSKVSVAINPVHIKSRSRGISNVMPTASSLLSDGVTDNDEDEIVKVKGKARGLQADNKNSTGDRETLNGHQADADETEIGKFHHNTLAQDESAVEQAQGKAVDADDNMIQRSRKTKTAVHPTGQVGSSTTTSANRASSRGKTKAQSKPASMAHAPVAKKDSTKRGRPKRNTADDEANKSDHSGKSLPSAFNVGKRLQANSKRAKSLDGPLSTAAKSRKAIREKVFSKLSPSFLERPDKPVKRTSKLHVLNPERRREPRSGDASVDRSGKEDAEEPVDIIQDSLPLADSYEGRFSVKLPVTTDKAVNKRVSHKKSTQLKPTVSTRRVTRSRQEGKSSMRKENTSTKKNTSKDTQRKQMQRKKKQSSATEPAFNDRTYDEICTSQETSTTVKGNEDSADEVTESYIEEASTLPPRHRPVKTVTNTKSSVRNHGKGNDKENNAMRDLPKRNAPNQGGVARKKANTQKDNEGVRRSFTKTTMLHKSAGDNKEYLYVQENMSLHHISNEESDETSEEEATQPFVKAQNVTRVQRPKDTFFKVRPRDEDEEDGEMEIEEMINSLESEIEVDYESDVNTGLSYSTRDPGREETSTRRQSGKHLPQNSFTGRSDSLRHSRSLDDSGIGETPFGESFKRKASTTAGRSKQKITRSKSWRQNPREVSVTSTSMKPGTGRPKPRGRKGESHNSESHNSEGDDNSVDAEIEEEESAAPHWSETKKKQQKRKRKFVDWSTSGRSKLYADNWDEEDCEPSYLNETHDLTERRGQPSYKPRKLSYEETPNLQEEEEGGSSDEEEIRREVQGLINQARGDIVKAVRRKRVMVQTFFKRTHDTVLNTIDSFCTRQQTASFNILEKYKAQFSDQSQAIEKDMDKSVRIVREMEKTFDTLVEQSKILMSQREVEGDRFRRLQNLQGSLETELMKLERRRNEQETSLRSELQVEMLGLQNKFLQDTRKQEKDHLKLTLSTLRIP